MTVAQEHFGSGPGMFTLRLQHHVSSSYDAPSLGSTLTLVTNETELEIEDVAVVARVLSQLSPGWKQLIFDNAGRFVNIFCLAFNLERPVLDVDDHLALFGESLAELHAPCCDGESLFFWTVRSLRSDDLRVRTQQRLRLANFSRDELQKVFDAIKPDCE